MEKDAAERNEGVLVDDLPPGEAGRPNGVRGEVQELSRSDIQLHGLAVRSRWKQSKRAYRRVPRIMLSLVENSEDERVRVSAAKVIVDIEKQILAVEMADRDKDVIDAPGVTVNVGVQVSQREDRGLTDEELDRAIDERFALLASIEAKDVGAVD